MIKYFQTTSLILAWCFLFSLVLSFGFYAFVSRRAKNNVSSLKQPIIPALILGPVLLVLMFQIFHINLIFPAHLLSTFADLLGAATAPALVLIIASGLVRSLFNSINVEYVIWRQKTFATVALSLGKDPAHVLRRIVVMKSLLIAWSRCLPWLFGELIIVECIFNAPGLGLDAWHLAKVQNYREFFHVIVWLMALYASCVFATSYLNRWLGRRLESYV